MVDPVALEDIEVPLWGLRDSTVGYVALSTALDWAGRQTLCALGEVGLPRTPGAHPYHCERDQLALEAALKAWLGELIGAWYRAIPERGLAVPFFELLRDWCYQIYNETIAYSTVECFVKAISTTLHADGSVAPEDRDLLVMMEQFLRLLLDDAAIFRGVSRASNDAVGAAVKLANDRVASMLGSFRKGDHAFSAGNDQADLWLRLWWEAATLRGVYQGISVATQALREHNRLMEGRCRSPRLDGAVAQQQAEADAAAVAAGIANAHGRVAAIIRELSTSIATVGREPKGRGYVAGLKSLASRLSSWEQILASMSVDPAESMLGVSSMEIRYCFPFAVNIDPERLQAFHPDLERHSFAARLDDLPAATTLPSASPLAALVSDKLLALGQGATPRARSIRLTEFWNGAGNGLFGGVRVTLPD